MSVKMPIRSIPVFLMILLLFLPAFLFAGGKKEQTKETVPTEEKSGDTGSEERERVSIDMAETGDNAAIVNGTAISRKQYEQQLATIQQQYMMQGMQIPEERLPELKERVLESLIDQELLAQTARKSGMSADADLVDQQLSTIKDQFPSEEDYKAALSQQGIDEDALKKDISKAVLVQQFIMDRFGESSQVSEDEIRSFYDNNPDYFKQPEQVRASHILFQAGKDATETELGDAKQKAEDALKRYNNGEEFSTLATELSEGPSAAQGGDLGFFGRSQMVKPFEDAVFSLDIGEVAGPVKTDFGYHLIKLTAKNEAGVRPFEQVKAEIVDHLGKLKLGEQVESFLNKEKEDADIRRLIEIS
jgi:peptidyl-prolyl cis-trans isomerase C